MAQDADADRRLAGAGTGERAGAEQLGIVGVGNDRQHPLAGEIESHG